MAALTERIDIPAAQIAPGEAALLRANGIPEGTPVREEVMELARRARARTSELGEIVALVGTVEGGRFAELYAAAVGNEEPAPLVEILPRAQRLSLFVVTLGEVISQEIEAGFASHDFAWASMLDTAASLAADRAVRYLEARFEALVANEGDGTLRVLSYSPGYCGWNLSGQGPLFEQLGPEAIGVRLDASFLMRPLKSVSGVLVAAPAAAHAFANTYEFCQLCRDESCRKRIGRLRYAGPAAGD